MEPGIKKTDNSDIEFIKRMCNKADRFEFKENNHDHEIIYHVGYKDWIQKHGLIGLREASLHYPLLLQGTIESINRDRDKWRIIQTDTAIRLYDSESGFTIPECIYKFSKMSEVKAKESVLQYIYEQDKNKWQL